MALLYMVVTNSFSYALLKSNFDICSAYDSQSRLLKENTITG